MYQVWEVEVLNRVMYYTHYHRTQPFLTFSKSIYKTIQKQNKTSKQIPEHVVIRFKNTKQIPDRFLFMVKIDLKVKNRFLENNRNFIIIMLEQTG